MQKNLILVVLLFISSQLFAADLVVFKNEYKILKVDKPLKRITVGNKDLINVSFLHKGATKQKSLKVFGKKSGSTSLMLVYKDKSVENYHVFVNQNLGFVQNMVNEIAPAIKLQRVGDGSTVISGKFENPHQRRLVEKLLINAGIDANKTMDITKTQKMEKMVRTKLYLVEIDNSRAEDLGGAVGLGLVAPGASIGLNSAATTSATFSGFLLDNTGSLSTKGTSLSASLNFLQSKNVAKIMDDTVLLTTEDKNASFHVGGRVYIPTSLYPGTAGQAPLLQLEEKEYGLRLRLKTFFLDKENFLHLNVKIESSEFDTNQEHEVSLGNGVVVPSFTSKNISTDIVSKAGNVIALGGRMHTETVDSRYKIPLLGDLPLIGWLFRSSGDSVRAKDLIFFLVPEIVDGNIDLDETNFYNKYKEETQRHWDSTEVPTSKELETRIKSVKDSYAEDEEPIVEADEVDTNTTVEITNEDREIIANEALEKEDIKDINSSDASLLFENQDKNETIKEKVVDNNIIAILENNVSREDEKEKLTAQEINTTTEVEEKNVTTKPEVPENRELNATLKVEPKNEVVKPEVIEPMVSVNEPKEVEKFYRVIKKEVYLRSEAGEGFRIDSWENGHKFKSDSQKEVNGAKWLKISQDCLEECEDVEVPLWIAADAVESETKKEKEEKIQEKITENSNAHQNKSVEKSSKLHDYSVSVRRVFLRDAPNNGKKVTIWGENHPFKSSQEKEINGTSWVNIVEDCRGGCKELENELWIAKKYTKQQ